MSRVVDGDTIEVQRNGTIEDNRSWSSVPERFVSQGLRPARGVRQARLRGRLQAREGRRRRETALSAGPRIDARRGIGPWPALVVAGATLVITSDLIIDGAVLWREVSEAL